MPYSVFVMKTVKLEVVCAESLLVLFALLGLWFSLDGVLVT
jgi:hypothetical protein